MVTSPWHTATVRELETPREPEGQLGKRPISGFISEPYKGAHRSENMPSTRGRRITIFQSSHMWRFSNLNGTHHAL